MNAIPLAPRQPRTRRWPARLGSLLLSAIVGAGLLVAAASPASALPPGGDDRVYVLANNLTGKVMDNANQSTAPGTPIIQWQHNGGANQEWLLHLRAYTKNQYVVKNRHSGLCLTARSDGSVTQDTCNPRWDSPGGGLEADWTMTQLTNGSYTFTSNPYGPGAGRYLAAPYGGTDAGLTLVDWGIHDIAWKIEEVPQPYSFETGVTKVPGWNIVKLTAECKAGYNVEARPGSAKPRFDFLGDSDLNVHDSTARRHTGTYSIGLGWLLNPEPAFGQMTVDVGNPLLFHTLDARLRVYCVPDWRNG